MEEEDNSANKSSLKRMDSLHKPAVPVEYLDEDLEKFLSSNPLADWRSQVQGGTEGRYLAVDPTVFPKTHYIKWDAHTLLPSLEFKTRKALVDSLSATDMLRKQNAKTRPLLVNWEKTYVWD